MKITGTQKEIDFIKKAIDTSWDFKFKLLYYLDCKDCPVAKSCSKYTEEEPEEPCNSNFFWNALDITVEK